MRARRPHLVALAAALAVPACGQAAAPAPTAAPAPRPVTASAAPRPVPAPGPERGPLLWQVDGAGGPSYLFGTLHAGLSADREISPVVWDKLAAADTFYMEADVTAAAPGEMMRRASLPAGQSLDKMLGKSDWNKLVKLVGRGVPARSLKPLQPWMVYSLVIQMLYPTPRPLDLALQERANNLGKPIQYLEDWSFQVDLLAQTMGVEDLRELVNETGKARGRIEAMLAAYREGDFEAIAAITLDPAEVAAHPERMRKMFDERNQAWVEALAPTLKSGRAFVAVGVGHFAGEVGILSLLRARGFTVRRVPGAAPAPAPPAPAPAEPPAPVAVPIVPAAG